MGKAMEHKDIFNIDIACIQHLPMIDFIGNDFAIFNDIKDVPFSPYPIRLDALCLAVCQQGRGRINIQLQEYEMTAGMMLLILPDQIVQQVEHSDDFSGSFIAVSRNFIDEVVPTMQQLYPLFLQVRERPCLSITAEEVEALKEYHAFMRKKVKLTESPFRKEITKGLLMSLFYEIYGIYKGHTPHQKRLKSRKEELFERFFRAISESYKSERSVTYYADKLCLTSKHLSTAVKEISGKTAGEWIEELVILEAKALLKSTEKSIQEISDELNFANQSFFGKYFKQHTGVSPKEYRKQ